MDYGRLVFAIIGFSASFFLCLPSLNLKTRRHRLEITEEKLGIVRDALEEAEERVIKFQERHDRMLREICSYYLVNEDLENALLGARQAMDDALEFAVALRNLQMKILSSLT